MCIIILPKKCPLPVVLLFHLAKKIIPMRFVSLILLNVQLLSAATTLLLHSNFLTILLPRCVNPPNPFLSPFLLPFQFLILMLLSVRSHLHHPLLPNTAQQLPLLFLHHLTYLRGLLHHLIHLYDQTHHLPLRGQALQLHPPALPRRKATPMYKTINHLGLRYVVT